MDVIIPSHNIKTLSNAVSALAKIGKFLYLEFDPLTGLTLRTLNDAKSSFAEFTFDVGFFERCSSGAAVLNNDDGNVIVAGSGMLLSSNRRRKTNSKFTKTNKNKRKTDDGKSATKASNRRQRQQQQQGDHTGDDDEEEEEDCEKYLCRVPIRTIASLLHYRKGLLSLRIRSINPALSDFPSLTDTSSVTSSRPSSSLSKMQLSFEFRIQPSFGGGGGGGGVLGQQQGIIFVTHRVFVSQSPSVVASASRTNCSEIVVDPVLWMKLIDPVQSPEMVLIVSERDRRVTASSFHYADGGGGNGGGDDQEGSSSSRNLVLSATASRVLKTETSVHCDEFDEFVYSDGDRGLTENGSSGDGAIELPEGIEHQVVLVFSSREAKAMAQFCVQQAGGKVDEMGELRLIVNFYWGGKPIVFETEGDTFQGVLILSTVHYSLLKGIVDWTTATSKKQSKIGSTK
mmetsp:Transcript_5772/g.10937  ORF Transcript_5772/g.10937 Transcript_5772/m.10937 type:complete len:456 (-) Transcript_5772:462-1829(-)|eukprot:CAMPEP_0176477022 /NCGR_PEP_ID=MMETSP0200_2-20121128/384_1 /TAXON_ID=947934 /ORGANISM="Chaetoceros sp., Strain GSL56" /LENGTH=455 /DNA_ID=CAMNT_0017872771 /DNA_START=93 /DNA_END=1460 /DNA_ORIENTATION=+